ncbi:hypothetical protein BATDEDRAFT_22626 [Batrachochytrium dendrobatidis JAM81]|uniref:Uncharacterized protein n=1 Tax=Batrachochytrium dendrobatidis (strain JAM81 / FGSC 10211) TaxID=684364 RepID=F4NX32_BATDJ|nr:uncharacterized protein BATDEDRAFT_22626 [Batrachochytrium dendrobatidis JAM81]EGF82287.1 hypothetical protein BATDEDRAFT_22626 [Batrachochytrium dendrobatidis JAM81]|eukprot:XP_006676586.1 hypothetical protein BATDEDRAFT_22626 [Batrachochytrium dendrobatidis JAM81]
MLERQGFLMNIIPASGETLNDFINQLLYDGLGDSGIIVSGTTSTLPVVTSSDRSNRKDRSEEILNDNQEVVTQIKLHMIGNYEYNVKCYIVLELNNTLLGYYIRLYSINFIPVINMIQTQMLAHTHRYYLDSARLAITVRGNHQ